MLPKRRFFPGLCSSQLHSFGSSSACESVLRWNHARFTQHGSIRAHFLLLSRIFHQSGKFLSASEHVPLNLPTNFHPDLNATILQMYLLSLCALLSQQSQLFPICVVSTHNDSRKDLHKLCQIPRNCQCR